LTSIIPIVDVMFRCRDMLGQSSKSVQKAVFTPARGVNAGGVRTKFF